MADSLDKDILVKKVIEQVEKLFGHVDFIKEIEIKKEIRNGAGPDFVVELSAGESRRMLLVETRLNGEPRFTREAVNALLVKMNMWSHAYPVFAAPYISEKGAEICREHKVGYLDLAGNCHLSFENFHIQASGHVNPFKAKRSMKSLSSVKTARIIRVLLNHPNREFITEELAKEAGVSTGLVSGVKNRLRDEELVVDRKKRITVANPAALLERWITESRGLEEIVYRYFVPLDFIMVENKIVDYFGEKGVNCAFTGLSGAVHLASGINYNQVHAYIDDDNALPGEKDGFMTRNGRTTVLFIKSPDDGVFYGARRVMPASRLQYCDPSEKTVDEIEAEIRVTTQIVSPIQVYHDLQRFSLQWMGDKAMRTASIGGGDGVGGGGGIGGDGGGGGGDDDDDDDDAAAAFAAIAAAAEKIYRQVIEPSW